MKNYDTAIFHQIAHVIPDIFIGLFFVALFVMRLALGEECSKKIFPKLSVFACMIGLLLALIYGSVDKVFLTKFFTYNVFSHLTKVTLLLLSSIWILVISSVKRYKMLPSFLYILTFGLMSFVMVCLSCNNFLLLLLGLEGYTICVCFLLMIRNNDTERRLTASRFLISSSIMTAIFFYGISLCYSSFGSFLFTDIRADNNLTSMIGIFLILAAILFKISAAPFHSWSVDIYTRAPLATILFFDTVSKLFMAFILTKVCIALFTKGIYYHQMFLAVVSVMSMLIGCIMPLHQKSIKKFIAYMSIGHIGFTMTVFAGANNVAAFRFATTYIISYIVPYLCFLASIKALKGSAKVDTFKDVQGLLYNSPIIAYGIVISLFAMAGLPPFIGFMAKIDIFKLLIMSKHWILLGVSCVYTLLCLVYTVKCSKIIADKKQRGPETKELRLETSAVFISLMILIVSGLSYPLINNFALKIVSGNG